jgi:hypothetical protein
LPIKIARIAWAMMAKGEHYKEPAALAACAIVRQVPRISAFFDFCASKLRPILTRPHT